MNISNYNITDVAYHYIGLRVLSGLPSAARREEQQDTVSRSVRKYVSDKTLRLLLPETRGTFDTVGERVCQELVHLRFAASGQGAYKLTNQGEYVLSLLNGQKHTKLRRVMVVAHLETYDNLRAVVQRHMEINCIRRPIVEKRKLSQDSYIRSLLEPTFKDEASEVAEAVMENIQDGFSKSKVEDALRVRVLDKAMAGVKIREAVFRSMSDRLVSLRLLNIMRDSIEGCEFLKSYSPCVNNSPSHKWYLPLTIDPSTAPPFTIYFCEPDMSDGNTQEILLSAIDQTFSELSPQGGYYDLPDVRDRVCELLRIPEASFDEGVNQLMDLQPAPLTIGLTYEKISANRKPTVRNGGSGSGIYNLIRRI